MLSNIILLIIFFIFSNYISFKIGTNAKCDIDTCENVIIENENRNTINRLNNVYDVKVSKEFEQMFKQNPIATHYESINSFLYKK